MINGWVRDIHFVNSDSGIFVNSGRYVTVSDILIQGKKLHHAISASWSADCLFTRWRIEAEHVHGTTISWAAHGNVFSHGYGKSLHSPPYISNVVPSFPGEWPDAFRSFKEGMLIAVEPMLAMTTTEIRSEGREWPIYTADSSLSVHYEADIRVTSNEPTNLTEGLFDLPEIVGDQ